MSRIKKTAPKVYTETIIQEQYMTECPNCKMWFKNQINRKIIRWICPVCGEVMEIDWDNAVRAKYF